MSPTRPVHPDVTIDEVMEAAERQDNSGFCLACGEEADGVEPDAREYPCDGCGERRVFGAEQLLVEGLYHQTAPGTDAGGAG